MKTFKGKTKYFFLAIFFGIVMIGSLLFLAWNNSKQPLDMALKNDIEFFLSKWKEKVLAYEEYEKKPGAYGIDFSGNYFDSRTGEQVDGYKKLEEIINKGEQAVPVLIAIYKDNNDLFYRQEIINILGYIGGNKAAKFLVSVFQTSKDYEIKSLTAVALGRIGDSRAIPTLIEFFHKARGFRYGGFRPDIIDILKNFKNNDEVIKFFISIITPTEAYSINAGAIIILSEVDDEKLTAALENLLKDEKGKEEIIDFLTYFLNLLEGHESYAVTRDYASKALNNIDNEQAVSSIKNFLKAYAEELQH